MKLFTLSRPVYSVIKQRDSALKIHNISHRLYTESAGGGGGGGEAAPADSGDALPALSDLLGRRHNYLRISLTERCNLRCQYCMPAEGVALSRRSELLTRAELLAVVRALAPAGVDKLRLTGGEPTLRADLADVVAELSAVPGIGSVSMTTNGLVLTRRLPALRRAGLSSLNVSLDSLRPERYERMARRPGLARVLAGVDLALQLDVPVKINTVLMKGFNDDEICDFVEFTKDRDVEVRFIEFMPFSGNKWDDSRMVPTRSALRTLSARHEGLRPLQPGLHDTARLWTVPGYRGRLGFISSMTQPFCGGCNRLRLTADGNLKVCLFGAAELSLRDALRRGADPPELRRLVRLALAGKRASHAGECASSPRLASRPAPPALPSCRHARAGALRGQPPHDSDRRLARLARRHYGTRAGDSESESESERDSDSEAGPFSHLDAQGAARMVDVGDKPVTARSALASCRLLAGARLLRLLRDARLPKGDALGAARVAGTLAAKRAADLIPLCHPLPLDAVRVSVRLPRAGEGALRVRCSVRTRARTGAEMEALTGCAVAALTLYDMCKAVDRDMRITDLRLVRKRGGRSDVPAPPPPPAPPAPAAPAAPAEPADARETFAPTNLMHF